MPIPYSGRLQHTLAKWTSVVLSEHSLFPTLQILLLAVAVAWLLLGHQVSTAFVGAWSALALLGVVSMRFLPKAWYPWIEIELFVRNSSIAATWAAALLVREFRREWTILSRRLTVKAWYAGGLMSAVLGGLCSWTAKDPTTMLLLGLSFVVLGFVSRENRRNPISIEESAT